jgi:hypothetical protein
VSPIAKQKEAAARAAVALANELERLCNALIYHGFGATDHVTPWTAGKQHGACSLMQDELRKLACMLGLDARVAYALVPQEPQETLPPAVQAAIEGGDDGS